MLGTWSSELHAASLRAGAALVDITPTNLPIRTAGNLTLTVVSKIHDQLHSCAFELDDGATRLAIAVLVSCMISREDFDAAKAAASRLTGIPVGNMLISWRARTSYSEREAEPTIRSVLAELLEQTRAQGQLR